MNLEQNIERVVKTVMNTDGAKEVVTLSYHKGWPSQIQDEEYRWSVDLSSLESIFLSKKELQELIKLIENQEFLDNCNKHNSEGDKD